MGRRKVRKPPAPPTTTPTDAHLGNICPFCKRRILAHHNFQNHKRVCALNTKHSAQAAAAAGQMQPGSSRPRAEAVPASVNESSRDEPEVGGGMDYGPSYDGPGAMEEDLEPTLPRRFILVKHHPHAQKPDDIIPLDEAGAPPDLQSARDLDASSSASAFEMLWVGPNPRVQIPWDPFLTFGDYIFTFRHVSRRVSNRVIDEDLDDLWMGAFSRGDISKLDVTFKTHRDMEKYLLLARQHNIMFETQVKRVEFDGVHYGGTYDVPIELRDCWDVIKQVVTDPTLAPFSTWFSQKRYLCTNGQIETSNPLYDEPWTGKNWYKADDDLPAPDDDEWPSCFLGIHIWLDKGLVSTKTKMHPILVRFSWIDSKTRNGSGNGGSMLLGFVRMPDFIRDVDPKDLSSSQRAEYDHFKRMVYHLVCATVLGSLRRRSHKGEPLRFGDGKIRIGYPGVLIESMDFEELAAWLAIMNSQANFPCPRCLVPHSELPCLTKKFPERTTDSMRRALLDARDHNKTERKEALRGYGLHDFEHFLWEFRNSDPYAAAGYDCLHFFDGGVWGRHVWVLLKDILQQQQLARAFNNNMAAFPRWRDLKHHSSPTTIPYSDAQTFLDILKCTLPCLVQLLGKNSVLVRLVRVMQKIRVMLGLSVTTKSRLDYLEREIARYERLCRDVSAEYGKNFEFLKQHFLRHAPQCFESLGTSRNMNTRVGEGFQQVISDQYLKTNGKNAEHQISIMDENEETMARIRMSVDAWIESQKAQEEDDAVIFEESAESASWKLGSADKPLSLRAFMRKQSGQRHLRDFDLRVREFIAEHYPQYPVRAEEEIKIVTCKALYVEYQSMVDWRSARDILRCNPDFHSRERFDSVIYDDGGDTLAMGQLNLVLRCHLPRQASVDLAFIRPYRRTSWHPNTKTDCPIREQRDTYEIISLEHVVRGALLCPIFGAARKMFYVVDCIDEDMFLRVNEIE